MKTKLPKLSEAAFQKQVIAAAHLYGWRVKHTPAVKVQRQDGSVYHATPTTADSKGFPDLLLLRGARIIAAELKVGRNKPSPEQEAWLADFRRAGVPAHVWYPADWPAIEETLSA